MNEETEFKFAGKTVIVTSDTWTYGNFTREQVNEINPETATKIGKLVAIERRKKESKEKRALLSLLSEFRVKVLDLVPLEYEVALRADSMDKKDLVFSDIQQATISKDYKNNNLYFRIEYNDRAYSSGDWHSHTANSPWTMNYDYKTIRYKTLEKLVTKGLEKLKDAEETIDQNIVVARRKNQKIALMSKELGYSVDKDTRWSSGMRRTYEVMSIEIIDGFKIIIDRDEGGDYLVSDIKIPYMGFKNLTAKQIEALLLALSEFPKER